MHCWHYIFVVMVGLGVTLSTLLTVPTCGDGVKLPTRGDLILSIEYIGNPKYIVDIEYIGNPKYIVNTAHL